MAVIRRPGSKLKHKGLIADVFPQHVKKLISPFFGVGHVELELARRGHITHLYAGDLDPFSVNLWKAVYEKPKALNQTAAQMMNNYQVSLDHRKMYNTMREDYNTLARINTESPHVDVSMAAMTLVINRLCFNGLHRVNKSGGFNVPWGKDTTSISLAPQDITEAHEILHGLEHFSIQCIDWLELITKLYDDDVKVDGWYFDPPYWQTNVAYTSQSFGDSDHSDITDVIWQEATDTNTFIAVSNSYGFWKEFESTLHNLFDCRTVEGHNSLGPTGEQRGERLDILITTKENA